MRDWTRYVRKNLSLADLNHDREHHLIENLARQLEDHCLEAISRGMGESDADRHARDQIQNWGRLRHDLLTEESENRKSTTDRLMEDKPGDFSRSWPTPRSRPSWNHP